MELSTILVLVFAWLFSFVVNLMELVALDLVCKEKHQSKTYNLRKARFFFVFGNRYSGEMSRSIFWLHLILNIIAAVFISTWISLIVLQNSLFLTLSIVLLIIQFLFTLIMAIINIVLAASGVYQDHSLLIKPSDCPSDNRIMQIHKFNSLFGTLFGVILMAISTVPMPFIIIYQIDSGGNMPLAAFIALLIFLPFLFVAALFCIFSGFIQIKITSSYIQTSILGLFLKKRLPVDQIHEISAVLIKKDLSAAPGILATDSFHNKNFFVVVTFSKNNIPAESMAQAARVLESPIVGALWKPAFFHRSGITKEEVKKQGFTKRELKELGLVRIVFRFTRSELNTISNITKKPIRICEKAGDIYLYGKPQRGGYKFPTINHASGDDYSKFVVEKRKEVSSEEQKTQNSHVPNTVVDNHSETNKEYDPNFTQAKEMFLSVQGKSFDLATKFGTEYWKHKVPKELEAQWRRELEEQTADDRVDTQ